MVSFIYNAHFLAFSGFSFMRMHPHKGECRQVKQNTSNVCTDDRYIFGKNEKGEKIKMTTPVYTESSSALSASGAKIQIVLPSSYKLSE